MTGREKLRRLAQDIAGLIRQERRLKTKTIAPELGKWFVKGVQGFLSNKNLDLEKALGLPRGRGRPPKKVAPEHARELSETKSQKSWLGASDELKRNSRTLQRSKSRYEKRLDAEKNAEISAKIIEKLKKADAARTLARRSRLVIPPK